jgi:lysozyme
MKKSFKVAAAAIAATVLTLLFIISCSNNSRIEDEKTETEGFAFGIDVSQYNGDIDWPRVAKQKKTKDPIKFVVIRSTVGVDKDTRYETNYKEAKENGFIVGSYHYYRPNENSSKQFENFKAVARLEKGDVLPVIDIEVNSTVQSMSSLKVGLRNFVTLCEKEYGVKPIIYTKLSMWRDYLQADFSDCPVWIAAYSTDRRDDAIVQNANLHQFTDRIKDIPGIPSKYVDGDDCRDLSQVLYK